MKPPPPRGSSHITARLYTDPESPWAYSASPALRVLEWRYREQIDWQQVMVGPGEQGGGSSVQATPEPVDTLIHLRDACGMPFDLEPKLRPANSSMACEAVISSRLQSPGSEWKVLRALQLLQFNSPLLLDDDSHLRAAISTVSGIDTDAIVDGIEAVDVKAAYRADQAEARSTVFEPGDVRARSTPSGFVIRSSPPSIVFRRNNQVLEAIGFQSVQSWEGLVNILDPNLRRIPPPRSPYEAVLLYPSGLTTQEVAAIMAAPDGQPDRNGTERRLAEMAAEGRVNRVAMGNDAIWLAA